MKSIVLLRTVPGGADDQAPEGVHTLFKACKYDSVPRIGDGIDYCGEYSSPARVTDVVFVSSAEAPEQLLQPGMVVIMAEPASADGPMTAEQLKAATEKHGWDTHPPEAGVVTLYAFES